MTFKILTIILLIYAVGLHVVIYKKLCILRQGVNVLIRSCFLYATTFDSSVLCLLHGSGIWFLCQVEPMALKWAFVDSSDAQFQ